MIAAISRRKKRICALQELSRGFTKEIGNYAEAL